MGIPGDDKTKILLDYHAPEGPVITHVRSTLLSSSLQTLRELGYFDRYVGLLDADARDPILLTLAPTWLPVKIAEAHYRACEALQLSGDEMEYVGAAVAKRFMGTFLQTFVRSSRSVGGSPWVPIRQYDKLWSRIWQGGGVRVWERGPKDALIESAGLTMVGGRYFSTAYMGVIRAAASMFASTVYVRAIKTTTPNTHACSLSWV
ncbi:MAG: hypothetical protein JWN48_3941 [Myxococcaceae bacterium]|nr:hypothetical protein [Myxococcaceae bacterium]